MVGRVVSTKMNKTASVLVESKKTHPLYKKSYLRTKKYLSEDPFGVSDGDIVVIEKSRPISKRKHWLITKVLGRDVVSLEQAELQQGVDEKIAEVMPEEREEELEIENKEPNDKKDKTEVKEEKKTRTRVKKA